jgi:hypothetical protein
VAYIKNRKEEKGKRKEEKGDEETPLLHCIIDLKDE